MTDKFKNTFSTTAGSLCSRSSRNEGWRDHIKPEISLQYQQLQRKNRLNSTNYSVFMDNSYSFSEIQFRPYQTLQPFSRFKTHGNDSEEDIPRSICQFRSREKKPMSRYEMEIKEQQRSFLRNYLISHYEKMHGKKF